MVSSNYSNLMIAVICLQNSYDFVYYYWIQIIFIILFQLINISNIDSYK